MRRYRRKKKDTTMENQLNRLPEFIQRLSAMPEERRIEILTGLMNDRKRQESAPQAPMPGGISKLMGRRPQPPMAPPPQNSQVPQWAKAMRPPQAAMAPQNKGPVAPPPQAPQDPRWSQAMRPGQDRVMAPPSQYPRRPLRTGLAALLQGLEGRY